MSISTAVTGGKKRGSSSLGATLKDPLVGHLVRLRTKGGMMMKKFDVNIKADTWYCAIEAETEQEAIERALGWFLEYEPDVCCMESEEED